MAVEVRGGLTGAVDGAVWREAACSGEAGVRTRMV